MEPLYGEVLGTMRVALLCRVSQYKNYQGEKTGRYGELGPAGLPREGILLYPTSL